MQFNLFGGGFVHKRSGRGRLSFRLDFWAGQLLGLLLLGVFLILLASSALFVLKPRYRAVVEVPVARWYCRGRSHPRRFLLTEEEASVVNILGPYER